MTNVFLFLLAAALLNAGALIGINHRQPFPGRKLGQLIGLTSVLPLAIGLACFTIGGPVNLLGGTLSFIGGVLAGLLSMGFLFMNLGFVAPEGANLPQIAEPKPAPVPVNATPRNRHERRVAKHQKA